MAIFFRKVKSIPKRVLAIRTDQMGDLIQTLPAIEALATRAGAEISLLCRRANLDLVKNNPFLQQVIAVDDKSETELLDELRQLSFDALIVFVNDPIIRHLLPRLKFIPLRIGPLSKPSMLFRYTHPVLQKRSRSLMNEAEYNLELVEALTIEPIEAIKPKLYLDEAEKQAFSNRLAGLINHAPMDRLVTVHAGMRGSALNMGDDFYWQLILKLKDLGFDLVLTGASEVEQVQNAAWCDKAKQQGIQGIFDLSGKLDLRQLACLLAQCRAMVGPSTGPTHLAASVGTPVVSFYPPIAVQSAQRWQPFLAQSRIFTPQVDCGQRFRCLEARCPEFNCMQKISVQSVAQAVDEVAKQS